MGSGTAPASPLGPSLPAQVVTGLAPVPRLGQGSYSSNGILGDLGSQPLSLSVLLHDYRLEEGIRG